ncbi:MAG: hypothetical protein IJ087_18680 [Eggerthellaceae bacterium]|nr:hypothetical protein [Eggerthellaceae bacterium]
MRCKVWQTAGETIVESLVSMLIIALVFAFLANAVIVAARINASVLEDEDTSVSSTSDGVVVKIDGEQVPGECTLYEVKDHDGEVKAYYYEYQYSETPSG